MIKKIDNLAVILLMISGVIWGILGTKDVNLVTYIFPTSYGIVKFVYVIFGLAAVCHILACRWKKRNKAR